MEQALIAIGSFLIGYVGRVASELFIGDRTERRRQSAARAALQRETLMELQDEFHRMVLLWQRIYGLTEEEFGRTGKWSLVAPEGWSDDEYQSRSRVLVLESRVEDEQLRGLIHRTHSQVRVAVLDDEMNEADREHEHRVGWQLYEEAMERMGHEIRRNGGAR